MRLSGLIKGSIDVRARNLLRLKPSDGLLLSEGCQPPGSEHDRRTRYAKAFNWATFFGAPALLSASVARDLYSSPSVGLSPIEIGAGALFIMVCAGGVASLLTKHPV